MSVVDFVAVLPRVRMRKNDAVWFPRWLRRYGRFLGKSESERLVVSHDSVLRFLQLMRDRGVAAWQRLQAVSAIELYQRQVLQDEVPSLAQFRIKLSELAARERKGLRPLVAKDDRELVGKISAAEPRDLQQLRTTLRRYEYDYDTELAYAGWLRRFMEFHQREDVAGLGEAEITAFLTALVTEDDMRNHIA